MHFSCSEKTDYLYARVHGWWVAPGYPEDTDCDRGSASVTALGSHGIRFCDVKCEM